MRPLPTRRAAVARVAPARHEHLTTRPTRLRRHRPPSTRTLQPPTPTPQVISTRPAHPRHVPLDLGSTLPTPTGHRHACHGSALKKQKTRFPYGGCGMGASSPIGFGEAPPPWS